MGGNARKPVFRESDQVIAKLACSATETTWNKELLFVASFEMIHSNQGITKAPVGLSAPLLFAKAD